VAGRLGDPDEDRRLLYISLDTCWIIPAALLLPLPLAAPAGLALGVVAQLSQKGHGDTFTFVFSISKGAVAASAAAGAAWWTLDTPLTADALSGGWRTTFGVLLAMAAYHAVDYLIVPVVYLSDPDMTWREARGEPTSAAVELALLCLGGLLAVVLAGNLTLLPLALPLPFVLQRLSWLRTLRLRADRDPKTGLLNAEAWRSAAEAAVQQAALGRGHVAVLMVDLDHFKQINDEHGHLAGDDVLRAVAAALQDQVRPDSLVGRFGGEEFVVLLPGADTPSAVAAAERLREAVQGLGVRRGDRTITVTASVGVSAPLDENGTGGLLATADDAVYAAKAAGRNRVRLAGRDVAAVA
jgi:diguanylate cyclase (GGDEF)-like protein